MTKDEFRRIVYVLKAVYTQPGFLPDQEAFLVWYDMLKDLPPLAAESAARQYILTEKYPPTISDLRRLAARKMGSPDEDLSELSAWHLVRCALRNSSYCAEEEYARLPVTIQRALGSPQTLRQWAAMEVSEVETVEQSHFLRCYRAERIRAEEDARLPEEMRTLRNRRENGPADRITESSPAGSGSPAAADTAD